MELASYLLSHACDGMVFWKVQTAAARDYELSIAQVEEAILGLQLLPARYQRNQHTLSTGDQLALFRGKAAVIGCGGLGGYLIEELARLGVGTLILCDPDIFEEHNLNRQLYSAPCLLDTPKVVAAAERVKIINPAVTVIPHQVAFSEANGRELLADAHIVLDGLDSITTRRTLAQQCIELKIPLVHGAIGGWYGQVATQMPGDKLLPLLEITMGEHKGIEKNVGNPAFTPALVASLQVAEACKILLNKGSSLSNNNFLYIDLLEMLFDQISFAGDNRGNTATM